MLWILAYTERPFTEEAAMTIQDCNHTDPWVITGSGGAWCYVCGAIKLINGL